ncbi:hypothetical protein O7632_14695 [Solwaraspora sp. WMMD406]|uniref:hypothetical protein n=1 Tax=Solwaraspora sp. WMMD406 TaxID=3016095 RepID=UPI002417B383|nr:hypothetical protein [Solwaraspora sp. WMMD406]MDG4765333.1 hypothetical protein [Solwaraspora sp. WMMD406]
MTIDKRDRPGRVGQRGTTAGAPRSGGRTTERRDNTARRYATQGSAALQEPASVQEPVRFRDTATEETVPRLRVAPPAPVAVPRAPFIAMILVVVVGGVLGVLLVNTKINENAIRLGTLQQEQSHLDLKEQQLKKEIAQHEAPNNLAAQARKLGLVESGPPAFIRLPDGRVIGVPQPATGEPSITSPQG